MRNCSKCKKDKPITEFYKATKNKDGIETRCSSCCKERSKAWRPPKVRKKRREKCSYTIEERKVMLDELRSVPCADCTRRFPSVCMDFDHLPGTVKEFGIMNRYRFKNWKELLAEIEKCEIVCANCHRIRTKERRLQPD